MMNNIVHCPLCWHGKFSWDVCRNCEQKKLGIGDDEYSKIALARIERVARKEYVPRMEMEKIVSEKRIKQTAEYYRQIVPKTCSVCKKNTTRQSYETCSKLCSTMMRYQYGDSFTITWERGAEILAKSDADYQKRKLEKVASKSK